MSCSLALISSSYFCLNLVSRRLKDLSCFTLSSTKYFFYCSSASWASYAFFLFTSSVSFWDKSSYFDLTLWSNSTSSSFSFFSYCCLFFRIKSFLNSLRLFSFFRYWTSDCLFEFSDSFCNRFSFSLIYLSYLALMSVSYFDILSLYSFSSYSCFCSKLILSFYSSNFSFWVS
jgi:hypothetical protein